MPDVLRHQLQTALGTAYTLERELGGGGMARVFVARETRLGRQVVVKVLTPGVAAVVQVKRFEREMRVAARLQDPRIVPILRAGDADGVPYYTMPFVDGESLHERMGRGRLPVAASVAILRDIALALEHAHARGVVHRDIKPGNVLLSHGTAVVTDFGIAKAIEAAAERGRGRDGVGTECDESAQDLPTRTLTEQGLALGTPAYMAPEQAMGDAAVDQRADIYAWGVVAYELLAGEHPFGHRTSAQAMVAAHIAETPPPLRARARGAPRAVADLVDRALRKDPAERPPDAGALLRALDGAAPGRAVPRGARLAAALLGVVALTAGVALFGRDRSPLKTGAAAATAVRSVAVMPFTSPGGDTTAAHLGGGMADALTTTLARLPDLRVISARSLSTAGRAPVDARAAGARLKVDAVLDGTVQRSAGQLRIRAHLTRVSDGAVIWGERYDWRAGDMFALEDDATAAIATALRGTLTGERASVAAGVPRGTRDPHAYDLYLRGRYAWSKRGERGLRAAIGLFEQAIARDPGFARAHAGLAMAYVVLPIFSSAIGTDSALAQALRSADRALALDSSLADAHLATAYAHKMRWRWRDAERHFQAAAALAPGDATVHHWYGVYLYAVGDVDRATAELRRARELDPFIATIGTDGALALYAARRLPEARAEIHRAMVLDSVKSDTWLIQSLIQLAEGHADSAGRSLDMTRRLGTGFDVRPYLSVVHRALGRDAAADSAYAEVRRDYAAGRALPYDVAVAAVGAGDREAALAAVQRIVARRDMLVTELSLPCDPLFDPLKSDPRFGQTLSAAGLRVCPPGDVTPGQRPRAAR